MPDPAFDLLQLERHPNWYDLLPQLEAAQAEFDRIYRIRCAAGWEITELGTWLTHDHDASGDRITAEAWELDGYPKPEDPDYGEWHRAAYTYEARDNDQDGPEPYPLG